MRLLQRVGLLLSLCPCSLRLQTLRLPHSPHRHQPSQQIQRRHSSPRPRVHPRRPSSLQAKPKQTRVAHPLRLLQRVGPLSTLCMVSSFQGKLCAFLTRLSATGLANVRARLKLSPQNQGGPSFAQSAKGGSLLKPLFLLSSPLYPAVSSPVQRHRPGHR